MYSHSVLNLDQTQATCWCRWGGRGSVSCCEDFGNTCDALASRAYLDQRADDGANHSPQKRIGFYLEHQQLSSLLPVSPVYVPDGHLALRRLAEASEVVRAYQ